MNQANVADLLDFGEEGSYRRLDLPAPDCGGGGVRVDAEAIAELSRIAFGEIAFRYPLGHLEKLRGILDDPEASENDRFVAATLLENAAVAAEGILPMCQDTGTGLVYGWQGSGFSIGGEAATAALSKGIADAYSRHLLRNSILASEDMLSERNTGNNLPAAIDIRAVEGNSLRLLFAAKGGGSSSRFSLSMESPAILRPEVFRDVLKTRISALGAAGCPPYTIGAVLGGQSPSQTMYMLELAVYGLLDRLPPESLSSGMPLRSRVWESEMSKAAAESRIGAQWGGTRLALESRVIRLPRHAANLALAVGVSCSAHRKARAIIDRSGWFLERMEQDPARLVPKRSPLLSGAARIDLDAPKAEWLDTLRGLKAGATALLSGTVTVARDKAHARVAAAMRDGKAPPSHFLDHPIFYAGPTEAAEGQRSGSFGPTTASRMDPYLPALARAGASLVSIAKGGRGGAVRAALAEAKGVYLACVGGAAALAARDHVLESTVVDYPDLGMEAVRLVKLSNLPAIVAVDSTGVDLYK